jgi:hypothetical protein
MGSYFSDMADAVAAYPQTGAFHLTFEDVRMEQGTPGPINVNEIWSFKIRISNLGYLDMNNVVLHLHGENGTQVSATGDGPWVARVHSDPVHVKALNSGVTDTYYFKAPATQITTAKPLVSAHLNEWRASLSTMLAERSGQALSPEAAYSAVVYP